MGKKLTNISFAYAVKKCKLKQIFIWCMCDTAAYTKKAENINYCCKNLFHYTLYLGMQLE